MRFQKEREDIIRVIKQYNPLNLSLCQSGNAGYVLPAGKGVLVTRSSYPYDKFEASDVVHLALDGNPQEEGPRVTIEKNIYLEIAKRHTEKNPDQGLVILHCDARESSLVMDEIPYFQHMVGLFGPTIPVTPHFEVPGTLAFGQSVEMQLRRRSGCYARAHGFVVVAHTFDKALERAVWIEELACRWRIHKKERQLMRKPPEVVRGKKFKETLALFAQKKK